MKRPMISDFLCIALCAYLLPCLSTNAAEVRMPELFFKITQDIVTPHIEWAKPYYKGKIKALVLAPRFSHRETVELMERMDIECTPILLRSGDEIYLEGSDWGLENEPRVKKDAVLKELNDALGKDYDLIIMGHVATKKMPQDILKKIQEKVQNGCGLVYIFSGKPNPTDFEKELTKERFYTVQNVIASELLDDQPKKADEKAQSIPDFITNGIPFEKFKSFNVREDKKQRGEDLEKFISVYKYGNGRVVFINYSSGSGYLYLTPPAADELNYEYYQAFIIKVALWASKRDAEVFFKDFPTEIKGPEFSVAFSRAEGAPHGKLSALLSIRTSQYFFNMPSGPVTVPGVYQTAAFINPVYQQKIDIDASAKELKFKMPELPEGKYFIDLQLMSGDKKVNWAAASYVSTPNVFISELRCEPDVIDCKTSGKAVINVKVKLNAPLQEKLKLSLALFDNYDRLLAEKTVDTEIGSDTLSPSFEMEKQELVSTMLTVRASLGNQDGNQVKSIKTANITTIHRPFPEFTFFAWGGGDRDYVAKQVLRLNAGTGIVDAYRRGGSIELLKTADVRFVPDILRLFAKVKDKNLMSSPEPFWGNCDYRRELFEIVRKSVEQGKKFDTYAYLLGDEMSMLAGPGEVCLGDVDDFRRFLEQQYGKIENLNAEWETGFKSFKEINPITRKEMSEKIKENGQRKSYAALIDLWMFNYWTFADTFRFIKDVQREIDPNAMLGASTPLWNWWWRGYYWEKIAPALDFYTPYYTSMEGDLSNVDGGMSFAKPGTKFSGHAGSYIMSLSNEEYYTTLPHAMLVKGLSNFFWYFMNPGTEGCMSPSLDYYPQTLNTINEVKRIKSGLGKLILESKSVKRQIALLYSTPSYLFSFLVSGPHVPWNVNSFVVQLTRLGYQVDFVSPEQVSQGILSKYKVLILPLVQCMSNEESEKIKDFVKTGGIAVASLRPGIADEHGKYRGQSVLAELFGVKWIDPADKRIQSIELISKTKIKELNIDCRFEGICDGKKFSTTPVETLCYDPSVEISGAVPSIKYSFAQEDIERIKKIFASSDEEVTKKLSGKDKASLEERIKKIDEASKDIPFVLSNKYGEGLAVYLNSDSIPSLANILAAVFSTKGIEPPVKILKGSDDCIPGKWLTNFSFNKFDDGVSSYYGYAKMKNDQIENEASNAYYGVVKTGEGAKDEKKVGYEAFIDFGREGHLYDMMTGKYLGVQKGISDKFGPWAAKWYSLLPYKVEALKLSLQNSGAKAGQPIRGSVEVIVSDSKLGIQRHVINIQVLDKDGRSILYLAQNLNTVKGKVEFLIPTAMNDDVRNWILVFTDAATGISQKSKP